MAANKNMTSARAAKNDEFYTRLEDIEREMIHYRDHFRDKVIFLNCDDPESSNFYRYFELNFDHLGLKKLISTHYDANEPTYRLEITRDAQSPVETPLIGNGDFRSPEAVALLGESDIVVTNPPFSLFREYVAQLIENGKSFIILGSTNAITYKETWSLIQSGKLWMGGYPGTIRFEIPETYPRDKWGYSFEGGKHFQAFRSIAWFTNLDHTRRHEEIILFREYSPEAYPRYDNYDAIEVSKVADIPADYHGVMGVPITFLYRHSPEQFEIVGASANGASPEAMKLPHHKRHNEPYTLGKKTYQRIFIRRRQ